MKIVTLTENEFIDFANKHQYNSLYQTPLYAHFMNKNEHYKIHYLGFVDEDNLIGASLMLYKTLFWGYKYAYAPRGFLIDYSDEEIVTKVSLALKNLLRKQKFIFITIDPPVVASEKDKTGKTIQFNNDVNDTLKYLKKNNYEHLGFNLYNESILPRWNVLAPLHPDYRMIYSKLDNDIKEKISYANSICLNVKKEETPDINAFFEFIKKKYAKKGITYFKNLFEAFNSNNKISIFYARIDTKKYTQNANNLYIKEEEKNNTLANIIQSGDTVKYNIPKAISDKIISDKRLHTYKKDIVSSTKLLKSNPQGLIIGTALVIEEAKGINVLINYTDDNYERYNANALLTYEIMKYYGSKNYQYINLGSVTGNFNSNSKYYPTLLSKLGFNSSIIEYIGEFNLIINPTMYLIYKKKYKK